MLKINKKFAKKYDDYRRKEELQKFKDRFGDVKLSEAQKRAAQPAEPGGPNSDASSSSSTSDDSDCEAWTPGMEAEFLRVYAALHSGDARLYDPSVSWFQETAEGDANSDDDDGNADESRERKEGENGERHKPMYFNEYHRKYLLEGAYENEDQTAGSEAPQASQGDMQEAERIRKSLAESHANQSDDDEDSDGQGDKDGADAFLVKRRRLGGHADPADPMQRLHKFVSDQADDGGGLEPACKEDLAKLKQHWAKPDGLGGGLTAAERYLRDYITKEYWRKPPDRNMKPDSDSDNSQEDEEDEDEKEAADKLSEDEEFLARQSQFEAKWNDRTEARDPEFESGFRRTFARGDEDNTDEEDESDNDEELFVVAKKKQQGSASDQPGEQLDEEVTKELLRLERRKDSKRKLDGTDDEAVDVDDVAETGDCGVVVRSYPRRIADSLREATTSVARARQRADRRERRLAEKANRRREFDQLARMKSEELHQRLERLRRNAGVVVGRDGAGDRVADVLGGDFLEADFDPDEHDRRMAGLFDGEFYGEGDNANEEEVGRRPEFSDDEEFGDDPEAAEALRQRLQAEADSLGAEDLIRSGPGQPDLPCRFNYRQVEPNDFGLSAVEILLADDRELNAWCSVRKASQYREREADRRDRRRFHSSRVQERKAQLLPGMLKRLEAAAAFQDANEWAKATATEDGDPATANADPEATKKRRRKKKKKNSNNSETLKVNPNDVAEAEERAPRSRKKPAKKKMKLEDEAAPEQPPKEASLNAEKKLQKKKKNKSKKSAADRLQISEQRLLELGIDPKKFRRIRRSKLAATKADD